MTPGGGSKGGGGGVGGGGGGGCACSKPKQRSFSLLFLQSGLNFLTKKKKKQAGASI